MQKQLKQKNLSVEKFVEQTDLMPSFSDFMENAFGLDWILKHDAPIYGEFDYFKRRVAISVFDNQLKQGKMNFGEWIEKIFVPRRMEHRFHEIYGDDYKQQVCVISRFPTFAVMIVC